MAGSPPDKWETADVTTLAKKTPYLVRKGVRFYFRMRIPEDLRQVIGKAEHSEALGDVNKAQAEVLVAQHAAQWQERFLHERYTLGTATAPPAPAPAAIAIRYATPEQAQAVAAIAGRALLAVDEEARIEGTAWDEPTPDEFGPGRSQSTALPLAVAGRDLEGIAMAAADWLDGHGLTLPPSGTERRRVLYAFAQGMGKAQASRNLRDAGEPVETPPELPLPAVLAEASGNPKEKPAHQLTLRDVFDAWKLKPGRSGKPLALKTVQRGLEVVEAFEQACGNPPVTTLTRSHAQGLRDHLLAKGLEPATAKDRVDWVRSMLNYEVEETGRLTVNPWPKVKVEGAEESGTDRKATRAAEHVSLFSLPLFQQYDLPAARNAGRDAAYWVPVLGIYTGARITELAQLLVADVFEKTDPTRNVGLWRIAFRVTHPEWQSLKNKPSRREIPVHPELIRLGFLDYCKAMRAAGHERLFPLVQISDTNNAGGALSSWFSKVKTSAGWGSEHTFHSFRHGVETMLKRAKEPKSHIDRYTGHGAKDVADKSYTHLEPEDLVETVQKIRPEGLALPAVFPPVDWTAPNNFDGLLRTAKRQPGQQVRKPK
jgi:integrase